MRNESPESALQRLLEQDRMSRRRFMGRAGGAAFGMTALGALLSACGPAEGQNESSSGGKTTEAVSHPKTALDTVVFSNWPLYIDKDVIKDFKREFNATLKYTEDINDNNEFFGKVRQPLEQGDSIGRDLVALTDWMAARWIRLGYTEPIDEKNVPNKANLVDNLVNMSFDKGRKHSLPWQSGMTGIGYNKKVVGEVTSFKQLLDPKYKGKVTFLSEARDTLGLVMLAQMGKNPEDATIDDILAATEELDKINRSGQIRKFTGNEYSTDLAKGNVVMAVAWSGDMVQLKADNPDLEFVIPEEGGMLWSDNMMIPQKAPSPYGAEVAMNWFYDPQVAAKIAAYVNYVTPVKGVQEILAADKDKDTAALAENTLIFPDDATRQRLHATAELSVEEEQQMNEAFAGVTGA
ncbi:MAG TPA: spermidine/putrescine ABC transporter substrate-binding protein [Solirubrobacteraceae bacterium]|nr:spermidine/putrescine ABC transporter substrate-binding protein [Solirubrobacteraceae bacterium]